MALDDQTDLICERRNLGVLVRRSDIGPVDKTDYGITTGQADYTANRLIQWYEGTLHILTVVHGGDKARAMIRDRKPPREFINPFPPSY